MKKLFSKKSKEVETSKTKEVDKPKIGKKVGKETSLVNPDYNRMKLFKKGINLMADERLDDAVVVFEEALRIDPENIETLMKLGYARFHLDDHSEALRVYDKILEIDVANPEAWNLKGLVHYEQKKYAKALDAVEKATRIRSNIWNGTIQQSMFFIITKSSSRIIRSIEAFN